jgi:ABC-type sulfate/molybdate transport systems ATPase subunit
VFVTHDMEEAFRFCTDLLVLDRGNVIAGGPKHQLFEDPGTVAAARLTGCKNIVPVVQAGPNRLSVPAWDCELVTAQPVGSVVTHIGYRSHQIRFVDIESGDNVLPCWLVGSNEAPHEMTLYLRLGNRPKAGERAHVQADVPKDSWRTLSSKPQPWSIILEPARLLLLR